MYMAQKHLLRQIDKDRLAQFLTNRPSIEDISRQNIVQGMFSSDCVAHAPLKLMSLLCRHYDMDETICDRRDPTPAQLSLDDASGSEVVPVWRLWH